MIFTYSVLFYVASTFAETKANGLPTTRSLEKLCNGNICYEVIDRVLSAENDKQGIIKDYEVLRELRTNAEDGSVRIVSRAVLEKPSGEDSNMRNCAVRDNAVYTKELRMIIGGIHAATSQTSGTIKTLLVQEWPGEIDRFFGSLSQFNITTLLDTGIVFDLVAKHFQLPKSVQYLESTMTNFFDDRGSKGCLFDTIIMNMGDVLPHSRTISYPSHKVLDFESLQRIPTILSTRGVFILRFTPTSHMVLMMQEGLAQMFGTCYRYPQYAVKKETQLMICTVLPTPSPFESLSRSLDFLEAAADLDFYFNLNP